MVIVRPLLKLTHNANWLSSWNDASVQLTLWLGFNYFKVLLTFSDFNILSMSLHLIWSINVLWQALKLRCTVNKQNVTDAKHIFYIHLRRTESLIVSWCYLNWLKRETGFISFQFDIMHFADSWGTAYSCICSPLFLQLVWKVTPYKTY